MHPLFREAAPHIVLGRRIVDVGPGIRPQPFYLAKHHLCIEPHGEYADWLRERGYPVLEGRAIDLLPGVAPADVVFFLDVIEHMEKEEGLECVRLAREKARQVVIYTPLGFKEQSYAPGDKDAWGLNGTHWQTHRSGWEPREFPGARIIADGQSFFALLESQGVQVP